MSIIRNCHIYIVEINNYNNLIFYYLKMYVLVGKINYILILMLKKLFDFDYIQFKCLYKCICIGIYMLNLNNPAYLTPCNPQFCEFKIAYGLFEIFLY